MAKLSSTKAELVWEGISRVHCSMIAALEKDMVPAAGITLGWYAVLASLHRAPATMLRFQDLAKVAGLTDSGASRRLNQMIGAGLIDRHSCPTDRRGVYAKLTAKGKATHAKAHAVFVNSLQDKLGSRLDPADADVVQAVLARL